MHSGHEKAIPHYVVQNVEHITKNIYFSNHLVNKCVISFVFFTCLNGKRKVSAYHFFLFQTLTKEYLLVRLMQRNNSSDLALIKAILDLTKHP